MKPKVKWKKYILNDRDENPERKRETGRYRIEGGKLVRLPRKS